MAKGNKNPYREDCAYHKIMAFIQNHQIVTRSMLLAEGFSTFDITVVLSPRDEGKTRTGADCRGSISAAGHVYFMDKLKKTKGEEQRFRLRWRKTVMEKHVRHPKVEVKAVKTKKTKKAVEPISEVSEPAPAAAESVQ